MTTSEQRSYSAEASAAFERVLARLEEGDEEALARACRESPDLAPELESLWTNYRRVEDWFSTMSIDHGVLDSAALDLERESQEQDAALREEIQRLRDRAHSAARYEIVEELARGGMGVVSRVHDQHLDRDLAMKKIRGDPAEDPEKGRPPISARVVRRFLREARVMGRLDHPGIVPVHEIGVDASGDVYFTMPLLRGSSLSDVLALEREGRDGWTQGRVLEVLLKVADAVAFAHSVGIVHRDLKPANVMVGRFGETYVVDWGLARALGETESDDDGATPVSTPRAKRRADAQSPSSADLETRAGTILGTPAYMAPEQAESARRAGTDADVYSLGAILYHVVSGAEPYASDLGREHDRSVLDALRRGPPKSLADLAPRAAPELCAICEKAMSRDPAARYPNVRAFSDDLRAYIDGRVVRAHEAGAWPELKKWVKRNKPLAMALTAVVAALVMGSIAVSYVQAVGKSAVLRLSDAKRLADLERAAAELWPAVPARVPAMRAWLADAEPLAERRTEHERTLARMRAEHGALRVGGAEHERWLYEHAEEQWQHDTLASLVDALSSFTDSDPARGTIASMRARVEFAARVAEESLVRHADGWARAVASIRDRDACPAYQGLVIEPELGLVPLGRDPRSGLWEFAHLASGEAPARDTDGALVLDESTGIVLVLVPSGSFAMGSDRPVAGQPSAQGTDLWAREDESPRRDVSVDAFFVAKHEVTREQWSRCESGVAASRIEHAGEIRTSADASSDVTSSERASSTRLPVSSISWIESMRILRRVGLDLPNEAQWEYAARAGTATRWSTGNEASSLLGAANARFGTENLRSFEDGYDQLAPVAALAANPWGLHHVHGNVAEWTADRYAATSSPGVVRDAARDAEVMTLDADVDGLDPMVTRGGGFQSALADLRSAARVAVPAANHAVDIGVRPVRRLRR